MNSPSNPADDDQLVWPPLEEDLDAIEVLEIPWPAPVPPAAPAPTAEPAASDPGPIATAAAPEVVPQPAPLTPAPPTPSAPPRQGVIEVVELDAVAGTESYVLDIRDRSMPDIGRSQSGAGESAGRELQWPPPDADLDAVEVLELAPPGVVVARPGAQPLRGDRRGDLPEAADRLEAHDAPVARERKTGALVLGLGLAAAVTAGGLWAVAERTGPVAPEAAVSFEAPVGPLPDPEPSTELAAPAAVSERDDVESLVAEAGRALEAGDRVGAVDLAGAYLAAGGRARAAYTMVESVLSSARADVERARRDATVRVGTSVDGLAEASRREAAAIAAWRAGRYGPALRGMIEARREFTRLQAPSADLNALAAVPTPGEAAGPRVATPAPVVEALSPAGRPAAESPSAASALPPVPVNVPAVPARPTAAEPAPAPPANAESLATSATDAGIRRALRAYQSAYESLDARAAASVYPSVDERALARAFAGLNSQKLEFDRCEVTPLADGRARAACVGRTAFVPRVGNQAPRVESRRWSFVLARDGDAWRIAQAQVSAR